MILYLSQLYVYSGVYNWTRCGPLMNLRNMILNIALNLPWCDVLFCLSTLKRLLNLVLKVGLIHFCCFLSLKAEIFKIIFLFIFGTRHLTFLCGRGGIYALGAVAANYCRDQRKRALYLDKFLEVSNLVSFLSLWYKYIKWQWFLRLL